MADSSSLLHPSDVCSTSIRRPHWSYCVSVAGCTSGDKGRIPMEGMTKLLLTPNNNICADLRLIRSPPRAARSDSTSVLTLRGSVEIQETLVRIRTAREGYVSINLGGLDLRSKGVLMGTESTTVCYEQASEVPRIRFTCWKPSSTRISGRYSCLLETDAGRCESTGQ